MDGIRSRWSYEADVLKREREREKGIDLGAGWGDTKNTG